MSNQRNKPRKPRSRARSSGGFPLSDAGMLQVAVLDITGLSRIQDFTIRVRAGQWRVVESGGHGVPALSGRWCSSLVAAWRSWRAAHVLRGFRRIPVVPPRSEP